jgi:aryl-alcohol dehydrogenase-like predicted oxidoreductase
VIHAAFGADSNFIDTADVYSGSQVVAGKALRDRRRVVLTGKLNSALWAGQNSGGHPMCRAIRVCRKRLSNLVKDADMQRRARPGIAGR